ncbi:hypothetical protein [Aquimarina brevivitae]|uniref:Lipoprotein n=1 Tax=Aquimarina brevivitae TaxID=323412 RepID=A0A4Q7PGI4_9FLAO|nr:hypothetical protein [Aquimarina brevivitae]RZS99485.1 hypothetical protein EV197_0704 [Aquimarina brevivitae]
MIKKITSSLFVVITLLSCKNENSKKDDKAIDKTEEKSEKAVNDSEEKNIASFSKPDLAAEVKNFITCKKASTTRNECRNSITKVVSQSFNIEEFVDKEKGYVVYDSIRPIIERSAKWENLGPIDENNLNKAVAHANDDGLALIVDTSQSYGHVVMVLPGEPKRSGSWGMALPKVLSLANHSPEKSFHDKTLSYALQKSDEVQVYLRK